MSVSESLTLAAIGAGVYGALATLLLLYPGEYDSAKKSRFGRALLVGNASAALAGGASIISQRRSSRGVGPVPSGQPT